MVCLLHPCKSVENEHQKALCKLPARPACDRPSWHWPLAEYTNSFSATACVPFFSHLAHRFTADAFHDLQFDQFLPHQPQPPAFCPFWFLSTEQVYQVAFCCS